MTEPASPPRTPLEESLAAIEAPEERLRIALDHMRAAISQKGQPNFRSFWDTRRVCIDFFREGIHPAIRWQLWEEMRELTAEVRRLKEHLTEQAEFAAEQLELALKSLEEEIESFEDAVASAPPLTLPIANRRLEQRLGFYDPLQRQVTRLTSWASRINALRKELIRTDMRVGRKTKLFRRLSSVGDSVFPRRKALIQEISRAFVTDVDAFSSQLDKEPWPAPPYVMRDDIRAFQAFAKTLTVSSKGFTTSREILSVCWDKVRKKDNEWKQEQDARRESFREALDAFLMRIAETRDKLKSGVLTDAQASAALEAVEDDLRDTDLGMRERKGIRGQIGTIKGQIEERRQEAHKARVAKQRERAALSSAQAQSLITKLERLIETLDADSADVRAEVDATLSEVAGADLVTADRERIAVLEQRLQERLAVVVEAQYLQECIGAPDEAGVLAEVLTARMDRRALIREQVELLRRAAGSSGLDFEAAMTTRQQLEAQRSRLSELDSQINVVKSRLDALKQNQE